MSDRIVVKSMTRQHRGCMVAGPARAYLVHPETGLLHEWSCGSAAVEAGCVPEDAADLLAVPGYRRVHAAPAVRPIVAPDPSPKSPTPTPEPAAPPVDLSVLDLSVSKLRKALSTGAHDANLSALLEAENAGKTRKGAVAAITERMNPAGA